MGRYGIEKRNDRGDRFIQFSEENHLVLCNIFFQYRKRKAPRQKKKPD